MMTTLFSLDCVGSSAALLESCTTDAARRALHRQLERLLPSPLTAEGLTDERGQPVTRMVAAWAAEAARARRDKVLFLQEAEVEGKRLLLANDGRGARWWVVVRQEAQSGGDAALLAALQQLINHFGVRPITLFPHGALVPVLRQATTMGQLPANVTLPWFAYPPVIPAELFTVHPRLPLTPHLKRLEEESIYILREAVAEAERPVMLYSIGKDSTVMLHLARKAFAPAPAPFPLLHVDTTWKFREMYAFRDAIAQAWGFELIVYTNPEVREKGINPFDHGSALHTQIAKTEALKQALSQYRFDVVFGGARRDEEKARAKERIFSLRTADHRWDPKGQRPELWRTFNTRKARGESFRVFPLSNWTERDIWQYLYLEGLPVVPLYFAAPRPTVVRNGQIFVVDDDRFRLLPGETIELRTVRFRTLGCYPLTAAVASSATTLEAIIEELLTARSSERQGRLIDADEPAAMERKKIEGYF